MKRSRGERNIVVTALKAAVPYIRIFKRKVFVIKVGGAVFADAELTHHIVEGSTALLHIAVEAPDESNIRGGVDIYLEIQR